MMECYSKLFSYIESKKRLVDEWLDNFVPSEDEPPQTVHRAIRYALFPGGKRIRPILCIAAAEVVDAEDVDVLPAACAIEMIHTYSLIHDDLPCMDDDDFRRGRPTVHKVFGEAIAVLAGDGLLSMAFEALTTLSAYRDPSLPRIMMVVNEIAKASGTRGMVGGQVADIEGEGRETPSVEEVEFIHLNKTAKMIEVSLKAGALLAGAGYREVERLSLYGRNLGLAFQIVDDILGEIGDEKKLGKPVKRDSQLKKSTYPAAVGLEASRKRARDLVEKAKAALDIFEEKKCWMLKDLADYVLERDR